MKIESVIVSYGRTPIGSFLGCFRNFSTVKLGAAVIKGVINRVNVDLETIDEVIMGNVLSAGEGQAPARQAAIYAGLPKSVECMTINKVCGSGLKSVMLADQAIRCGDSELIIAGGMENMSQSPYYLMNYRNGNKMGNSIVIDSMIKDGLWDPYNDIHMGSCAEILSKEEKIDRIEQDEFAVNSYQKAINAIKKGYFKDEIIPIEVPQKKSDPIVINIDEEPEKARLEKMQKLKPAFNPSGTITAANASSISDGAAALFIMSLEKSSKLNINPICKLIAQVSFAHDPLYFTKAPGKVISRVLSKAKMSIEDIDLFEINEAFSNVVLATVKEHNIPYEKVNVHGGAISLGHPIGASGCRILVTLISALKKKNKKYGLATLCIGGGEASAVIVEMF